MDATKSLGERLSELAGDLRERVEQMTEREPETPRFGSTS